MLDTSKSPGALISVQLHLQLLKNFQGTKVAWAWPFPLVWLREEDVDASILHKYTVGSSYWQLCIVGLTTFRDVQGKISSAVNICI